MHGRMMYDEQGVRSSPPQGRSCSCDLVNESLRSCGRMHRMRPCCDGRPPNAALRRFFILFRSSLHTSCHHRWSSVPHNSSQAQCCPSCPRAHSSASEEIFRKRTPQTARAGCSRTREVLDLCAREWTTFTGECCVSWTTCIFFFSCVDSRLSCAD